MRAEIWAVILDVHDQPPSVYDNIDKISPGFVTTEQILLRSI
jgi:hypothetical protein